MISGQNNYILRMVTFHIIQILKNRICSPCIPFAVIAFFVRRQNSDAPVIPVKIPWDANADM